VSTFQDYIIDPLAVSATLAIGVGTFRWLGKQLDRRKSVDSRDHAQLQELIGLDLPSLVPVLKEVCAIMQDQPASMFKKASPGLNTRVSSLEIKVDEISSGVKELLAR
jgi:hypothetical protein